MSFRLTPTEGHIARSNLAKKQAASLRTYYPLPAPRWSHCVPDPDGDAWWDASLSQDETRRRIDALEGMLDWMQREFPKTPPAWMAEERRILAGLKRRMKGTSP